MTRWSVTLTSCAHSLLKCPSVLHRESVFFVVWLWLTGWLSSNNVTTTHFTHLYNTLPLIDHGSFYKVFLLLGSKWLYSCYSINITVQIFQCHIKKGSCFKYNHLYIPDRHSFRSVCEAFVLISAAQSPVVLSD